MEFVVFYKGIDFWLFINNLGNNWINVVVGIIFFNKSYYNGVIKVIVLNELIGFVVF